MNYKIQPCKWAIKKYGQDVKCEECPMSERCPYDKLDDCMVEIEEVLVECNNPS